MKQGDYILVHTQLYQLCGNTRMCVTVKVSLCEQACRCVFTCVYVLKREVGGYMGMRTLSGPTCGSKAGVTDGDRLRWEKLWAGALGCCSGKASSD